MSSWSTPRTTSISSRSTHVSRSSTPLPRWSLASTWSNSKSRSPPAFPCHSRQEDIVVRGHSIECRINSEDPDHDFRPSPGRITALNVPGGPGVRWDSHVQVGYTVPPYYDSLLGKLIVHAPTRPEALATMRRALDELVIEGVSTTIPLQRLIFRSQDFISGHVDTTWVERVLLAPKSGSPQPEPKWLAENEAPSRGACRSARSRKASSSIVETRSWAVEPDCTRSLWPRSTRHANLRIRDRTRRDELAPNTPITVAVSSRVRSHLDDKGWIP